MASADIRGDGSPVEVKEVDGSMKCHNTVTHGLVIKLEYKVLKVGTKPRHDSYLKIILKILTFECVVSVLMNELFISDRFVHI